MSDENDARPDLRLLKLEHPDELRKSLEQMRRTAPYIIEMYSITARLRKAHYDELLRVGFSQEQALELCKSLT